MIDIYVPAVLEAESLRTRCGQVLIFLGTLLGLRVVVFSQHTHVAFSPCGIPGVTTSFQDTGCIRLGPHPEGLRLTQSSLCRSYFQMQSLAGIGVGTRTCESWGTQFSPYQALAQVL